MKERYVLYPRTLTFLLNGEDILLIQRSPDARLFPGMFNGVGGHIERGENVLSAAQREVHEETGLDVPDLMLRCLLHVDEGADRPGVLVFVFVGHIQQRDVIESSEGTLHWVPLERIGELNLMPDLAPILTRILAPTASMVPIFGRSTISPDGDSWEIHFTTQAGKFCTNETTCGLVDPP
jgi:8-oxo-dGTP diphosphatase